MDLEFGIRSAYNFYWKTGKLEKAGKAVNQKLPLLIPFLPFFINNISLRELPVYCRHPCDARVSAGVRPGSRVVAEFFKIFAYAKSMPTYRDLIRGGTLKNWPTYRDLYPKKSPLGT